MASLMAPLVALCLATSAWAALPESSVYVQWQRALMTDIRNVPGAQGPLISKFYAWHASAAWNAIKYNRGKFWSLLDDDFTGIPRNDENAVVAFASHAMLNHIFPWWFWRHDLLIQSQLGNINDAALAGARSIGTLAANQVISNCVGDGFDTWADYQPAPQGAPSSIGKYQFTSGQTYALFPQLGNQNPMLLTKLDVQGIASKYQQKFQADKYFQSAKYYQDLTQTYTVGGATSTARTDYDNTTPKFWAGLPGSCTMAGQFINIAISVLPATYTLWDQARFFSLYTNTMSDAFTACWKTKYTIQFWRPISAITQGDGTSAFTPDPNWTTFLPMQFHPSYPSGHQCLTGAAIATLNYTLGGQTQVNVAVTSDDVPGETRTFVDLYDIPKETSYSRILAGLHFDNDNVDGLARGRDVFNIALQRFNPRKLFPGPWRG